MAPYTTTMSFKTTDLLLASAVASSLVSGLPATSVGSGSRSGSITPRQHGYNPIEHHFSTQYLGYQVAENSCSHRDLGFTGQIAGKWYATWGDTLWCDSGVTDPSEDTKGFHGMVRNAVSLLTDDPLRVHDLHLNDNQPVPHQQQLVRHNASWNEEISFGFGGTSFCETDAESKTAALFYLVNANEAGLRGAGVARVQIQEDGITPLVTKRYGESNEGWWWNSAMTPRYGDVAAYRDERSDYIYAWGGAPTSADNWIDAALVYLARVKAADAFNLSSYEYWAGFDAKWQKEPLTEFDTDTAVLWQSGQGQVVYNKFFGAYIFVGVGPGSGDILLRTAKAIEGPWAEPVKVYTTKPLNDGLVYAGVAHPYIDPSGQTLTISWTNNNRIEVAKVSFTK